MLLCSVNIDYVRIIMFNQKNLFMKKLFTLIALVTMAMGANAATTAEAVAGTYTVHSDVNFLYVSRYNYVYTDETVTITATEDDSVSVSYVNAVWGTYNVKAGVTVCEDGSYSLVGYGTATMTAHTSTSEYYADFEATIADGAISGTFSMESVMGGTTVTFASGDAPAFVIGSGEHRGYTETLFSYITTPMCDAYDTLTVAIAGADVFDITYTNATWGDYVVDSAVVVANEDGTYSITGVGTATMAAHGVANDYYCELSATVSAEGVFSEATFYMESVMGGTSVVFYEGSAPAYAIAGSYIGDLTGAFAYGTLSTEGDTVVVDWEDTATATVELNDTTWGYFLVEGAEVSETDSTYVLTGSGSVAMDNHAGGVSDYAFDFSGTISSDLSTYTFVYTLEIMGGLTITVSNVSDEETGIQTVTVKTGTGGSSNAVYDLSGRRVDSSYKGIVIKNGKKFVRK